MAVRFAHFSDVHLTVRRLGWTRRDLFSKKLTGFANVRLLGRGYRFRHAPEVVAAMRADFRARGVELLAFSGDATKLAFDSEFRFAAEQLGVNDASQAHGLAVPGNHDYYTRAARDKHLFENHFEPWMAGVRIDNHKYPFARRVGHAWFIGVNSSSANWWTFDASGAIGVGQLQRLRLLCDRLEQGPRIIVTHYPLRGPDRLPERRSHRLRDHAEALAVAKECGIVLWLHGHIHKPYILAAGGDLPFPTISVGSCTQTGRWAYNDCTLDGFHFQIVQRQYNPDHHTFVERLQTNLELTCA